MQVTKIGWIAAAGLAGVMIAGGFQAKTDKIGVVDISKVFNDSNLKKKEEDKLQELAAARRATLEFASLNSSFTAEQLTSYKKLSTNEKATDADKAQLEKLKAAVQAATKQYDDLRQKQSPSAAEITTLNDLGNRNALSKQAIAQWQNDFQQEVLAAKDAQDSAAFTTVRDAVRQVAAKQGFTIVFSERAAVFGATDISPEVQKIVDKK